MKKSQLFTAFLLCSNLLYLYADSGDSKTIETGPVGQESDDWIMPRTEYGQPDFQGTWHFGSRTPMQRPRDLGNRQSYSLDEVRELEAGMRGRLDQLAADVDPDRGAPEAGAVIRQEADDNFLAHYLGPIIVPVDGEYRTSVIVDPENGRLPLRAGFRDYNARVRASGLAEADGPEGQPLNGRCIMFGAAVPSLTPIMMNPNLTIVQNKDYVVITTEMVHDARIIPLNKTHREVAVPRWMGESVARWEGDTLVVHTRHFRPEQSHPMFIAMSDEFELLERYRLTSDNTIRYEFTDTDDKAYTQPVTGVRTITRNRPNEQVYEFACHEGNYSMASILRGARTQEIEAELKMLSDDLSEDHGAEQETEMMPENHHEGHHDEVERIY